MKFNKTVYIHDIRGINVFPSGFLVEREDGRIFVQEIIIYLYYYIIYLLRTHRLMDQPLWQGAI